MDYTPSVTESLLPDWCRWTHTKDLILEIYFNKRDKPVRKSTEDICTSLSLSALLALMKIDGWNFPKSVSDFFLHLFLCF